MPPGPRTVVSMFRDAGTFVVPVTINGQITLKFVVDSGAADVSIPADVVLTLFRTGTLTADDFLGKQTYTMADGSTVPSEQFIIRSLKIGDRMVENVTGSIAPVAGGLLLWQSFLGRFHSWSIDNQTEALVVREKRDFAQTSAGGSDCGEAWASISAVRTASIRRKRTLSQASRRRMLCPAPTRTALMASPRAPARRLRSSRPSDLAWPMTGSTAPFGATRV